jgi:hypothetical protein
VEEKSRSHVGKRRDESVRTMSDMACMTLSRGQGRMGFGFC